MSQCHDEDSYSSSSGSDNDDPSPAPSRKLRSHTQYPKDIVQPSPKVKRLNPGEPFQIITPPPSDKLTTASPNGENSSGVSQHLDEKSVPTLAAVTTSVNRRRPPELDIAFTLWSLVLPTCYPQIFPKHMKPYKPLPLTPFYTEETEVIAISLAEALFPLIPLVARHASHRWISPLRAFTACAACGALKIAQWISTRPLFKEYCKSHEGWQYTKPGPLTLSCSAGSLPFVTWFAEQFTTPKTTKRSTIHRALCGACTGGHNNIAEFIIRRFHSVLLTCDSDKQFEILASACESGNLTLAEYIVESFHLTKRKLQYSVELEQTVCSMFASGNLEMVMWMQRYFEINLKVWKLFAPRCMHNACKHGKLEMAKWLWTKKYLVDGKCPSDLLTTAFTGKLPSMGFWIASTFPEHSRTCLWQSICRVLEIGKGDLASEIVETLGMPSLTSDEIMHMFLHFCKSGNLSGVQWLDDHSEITAADVASISWIQTGCLTDIEDSLLAQTKTVALLKWLISRYGLSQPCREFFRLCCKNSVCEANEDILSLFPPSALVPVPTITSSTSSKTVEWLCKKHLASKVDLSLVLQLEDYESFYSIVAMRHIAEDMALTREDVNVTNWIVVAATCMCFKPEEAHLQAIMKQFSVTPTEAVSPFRVFCAHGDQHHAKWIAEEMNISREHVGQANFADFVSLLWRCPADECNFGVWFVNHFRLAREDVIKSGNSAAFVTLCNHLTNSIEPVRLIASRFSLTKQDIPLPVTDHFSLASDLYPTNYVGCGVRGTVDFCPHTALMTVLADHFGLSVDEIGVRPDSPEWLQAWARSYYGKKTEGEEPNPYHKENST
ncbi:hypothetical protein Pelo_15408 [Pelomyxa schiedti]|nr:hypothetical protein Pelo_15408 [Pelomyxa schiedti]